MAFLSVPEAAALLGVSKQRVYQLVNDGTLSADRVGRTWLVDEEGVRERNRQHPGAGRPSAAPTSAIRRYTLMNRTYGVLDFDYDAARATFLDSKSIHDARRAPMGIISPRGASVSGAALQSWWNHRSIPSSRQGIDAKLAQLGLSNPAEIPFESLGFSLSDQYWVRPCDHPELTWEKLNFFDNPFGSFEPSADWLSDVGLRTPDNTSEGMLPKRWVCEGGRRVLLKGGGLLNQEPYNELIACALYGRLLGRKEYVPYYLAEHNNEVVCASECFVSSDEEFTPAFSVMKVLKQPAHHSDYQHYLECCAYLGISDAEQALAKMIVCDDLLANSDRHLRNFGIVRNVETLECRVAPLFDTGSCLWAGIPTQRLVQGDYSFETKPFNESPARQLLLVSDFTWLDLSHLEGFEDEAREILGKSTLPSERVEAIVRGLGRRIERLQRILG